MPPGPLDRWHEVCYRAGGPRSGDKHGKEEVMAFFRVMMNRAGVGSSPPDIHDILASDDHAVVLMTRLVGGIEASVAVVYEIREGKIAEVWPHERDQYAVDEALTRTVQGG